jgi:hypothetical protein
MPTIVSAALAADLCSTNPLVDHGLDINLYSRGGTICNDKGLCIPVLPT